MAYDEELAHRVRELVNEHKTVDERRMFGGLSFLIAGHMAVCVSGRGGLMVRVGADDLESLLARDHAEPMVMGGRESRTWLLVAPDGVRTKRQLRTWVTRGVATALSLPPKG
jgi:TfoX/Sxy family transcriptional regulator of competence genes